MKSMTGFGRAKIERPSFQATIDISSVNKKGFELSVSLPRDWAPMERLVAQTLKKSVARGKVSVSVKIENTDSDNPLKLDSPALLAAMNSLKSACEKFGVKFEATPETILRVAETISGKDVTVDWEESWNEVEPAFDEAAKKLDEMRVAEGAALKADLTSRLNSVLEMILEVEKLSHGTAKKYKEQLLQRLAASGLELDPNDERVLKEICIFADKCDICEEITRMKSHIAQFLSALEEHDAVGRKMDFLCQEMGREINTTASKANSLELTRLTIDLKNELERIREQVQNVE